MTTPLLNEAAVIELIRAEQKRIAAKAEELWQRLKTAEEAKKPYQDAYDKILAEWSEANRLADTLAEMLKAKEQAPVTADDFPSEREQIEMGVKP